MKNKRMIITLSSVIGVILLIIIILILINANRSHYISFAEIKDRIEIATEDYFQDHRSELPATGTKQVSVNTLVENGYMNELSYYTNSVCTGMGYVSKIANGYHYYAGLNCNDDYSEKLLSDVLKANVVSSGSGLYAVQEVSPNTKSLETMYIFRGDNVKNYVKIGDYLWEIVKINENNEVMILETEDLYNSVWDNRYNINTDYYDGMNNYSVSRVKEFIDSQIVNYEENYSIIKTLINAHSVCVGKRSYNDTTKDGRTECSEVLTNQYFSLLPVYDYLNASLDSNCNTTESLSCTNYNYLADGLWWTITGVSGTTNKAYIAGNSVAEKITSINYDIRLVAALSSDIKYVSGSGTYTDPYLIGR